MIIALVSFASCDIVPGTESGSNTGADSDNTGGGNTEGGGNPDDVTYSEGLKFTSNGDGTCYVSGIGTCTDTDIVILPTSPEGDTVVSIGVLELDPTTLNPNVPGEYAFFNCTSLTSIVIPDSVESIGGSAFVSCRTLTDVYYIGTEEQWAEIIISGGNDSLNNATIHYNYVPEN